MTVHRTLPLCLILAALTVTCAWAAGPDAPRNLTCEHQTHPIALATSTPRFSWEVNDGRRGAIQSAYQVQVATTREALLAGRAELWDSGKVASRQSLFVPYAGQMLLSGRTYWWRVRTGDADGVASPYSAPASFGIALLKPEDWSAHWITPAPATPAASPTAWRHGSWIWHATQQGENRTVYLRKEFSLPATATVQQARLRCTADDSFVVFVNGARVGTGSDWSIEYDFDVTSRLRPGRNVIAVAATNQGGPCGFHFDLRLDSGVGEPTWVLSDATWTAIDREVAGWQSPDAPATGWTPVAVIAPFGSAPWARGSGGPLRPQLMRREFSLPRGLSSARVSVCGLGAYELRLNGAKVGSDILSPGWTLFAKHTQFQTYDVTDRLRLGRNALGVILGNGWWHGRIGGERDQPGRDSLRLILQLDLTFSDGRTRRLVTDGDWLAHPAPVLADDIYDGESYDARLEQPGWDLPGFVPTAWQPVSLLDRPLDNLVAQEKETIQPIQDLPAVAVTEPHPGVFIFDFGQNLTGWVRLKASGAAGKTITLRHGEELERDGSLYTANLRSARATDSYTLRGGGTEVWEPRFTYHGFRYCEVTGYPGRPPKDALVARMISSAVPQIGQFECSNDLLGRIQHNILWGQRGNMYDTPTDCPQRDERLGWTGDTAAFANTACWNLDMYRFFAKWMRDIRDCQGSDGAVRDVNPCNGGGPAAPAWGDVCVIVPWQVWRHYGDPRIIEDNYDCMTRWVNYMTRNSRGDLYERDGYGDWIAPVGSPKFPLSAAYYHLDCMLLSTMAQAIGRKDDAAKYADLAARIRKAFNARYLDRKTMQYPSGTQTAQLLPLFFGLVPPEVGRKPIVDNLVRDVLARGVHLSTGFLGTEALCPVLTSTGHHELAYALATQTTYPSWGYMVKKGATTIWELWNSDTAGPGMNSRNHFCLGSVGEWFYEGLGAILPTTPGFAISTIAPRPAGDLRWAKTSIHTPYGLVAADWRLDGKDLRLHCVVPANTGAYVWLPTFGKPGVKVSEGGRLLVSDGKAAGTVAGIRLNTLLNDAAVFAVGGGTYDFVAAGVGLPKPSGDPLPTPPTRLTRLSDAFTGSRIDDAAWQVRDLGLESSAPSGGIEARVSGGELIISGATKVNYWAGKTLLSRGGFTVAPGQRLVVDVERRSLAATGTGARSSVWLWVDPSNYLMFSQDTEKQMWSYNFNGQTGSGPELAPAPDGGKHAMRLIHDGTAVHMFLDGKELGKVPVVWREGIRIGLTGQARMSGDEVDARFGAAKASL